MGVKYSVTDENYYEIGVNFYKTVLNDSKMGVIKMTVP